MSESLYRKASLVMNPYGALDGELPSIKPTDGSGDFTFSRDGAGASPATRVNASGLIEKGRENLLIQSNSFTTGWGLSNVTMTGGQAGYDGSNDAWLMTDTNSAAYGTIDNLVTTGGITTFSCYAKSGTTDIFGLRPIGGSSPYVFFDLSNGTFESAGDTANLIDWDVQDVGGGWYRCSVTTSATATQVLIYIATTGGGLAPAGSTLYIQDAQLEQGLVATDYIETTTAPVSAGLLGDMPRLDYSGGATCPSLLLEPSRVNQAPHSEYIGGWVQSDVTGTDNFAVSPEGVQNAAKITASSTSAGHFIQLTGAALGNDSVVSMFAKADTGSFIQLTNPFSGSVYANFDVANGVVGTKGAGCTFSDIENYGNGWYRCIAVFNNTGINSTTARHYMVSSASAAFAEVWNPSTDTSLFVYGHQFESASYPTSYIPTYGSASTRGADVCSKTGISSLIGQTEGTFFIECEVPEIPSANPNGNILNTTNSVSNSVAVIYQRSSQKFLFSVFHSSVRDDITSSSTYQSGSKVKIALTYSASGMKLFINGQSEGTNTDAITFNGALSELRVIDQTSVYFGYPHKSKADQVLVFKTPLTDSECINLTTI